MVAIVCWKKSGFCLQRLPTFCFYLSTGIHKIPVFDPWSPIINILTNLGVSEKGSAESLTNCIAFNQLETANCVCILHDWNFHWWSVQVIAVVVTWCQKSCAAFVSRNIQATMEVMVGIQSSPAMHVLWKANLCYSTLVSSIRYYRTRFNHSYSEFGCKSFSSWMLNRRFAMLCSYNGVWNDVIISILSKWINILRQF